jgi:hypothetical protein
MIVAIWHLCTSFTLRSAETRQQTTTTCQLASNILLGQDCHIWLISPLVVFLKAGLGDSTVWISGLAKITSAVMLDASCEHVPL